MRTTRSTERDFLSRLGVGQDLATPIAREPVKGHAHGSNGWRSAMKCWIVPIGIMASLLAPLPTAAATTAHATSISAGGKFTCALLSSHDLNCWGYNGDQELGNGSKHRSRVPVSVHELTNVSALSSGWNQSCALLESHAVECWGDDTYGQLGNGLSEPSFLPTKVVRLGKAVQVPAGGYEP